jgi:NAD-dependent dihydropyrimidine dehydrogenase PreA subunit
MIRKIVQIDESKCDGCGQCIPSCAEGAIQLVNGKARLVGDVLCDGLGACLGDCPQGAITIIERDAPAFDEVAVKTHLTATRPGAAPHAPAPPSPPSPPARPRLSVLEGGASSSGGGGSGGGCPGSASRTIQRRPMPMAAAGGSRLADTTTDSRLGQWPIQLHLVPVGAPYFEGADLLVAADCVPFAYARFHDDFLAGRAVVVGCPKLDDLNAYVQKLGQILTRSDVKSVTVVRMEVPCCGGISMAAKQALLACGKPLPFRDVVIGVDGAVRVNGPA